MHNTITRLRICEPADIAEIVPILLGFYPTNSLVALYLHPEGPDHGSTVKLTARIDLPERDELPETAAVLTRHLGPSDNLLLTVFCTDHQLGARLLRHLQDQIPSHQIRDLIVIGDDRVWQVDEGGEPIAMPASQGRVSAEAVLAGLPSPTGDREQLEHTIQPALTPERLRQNDTAIDTKLVSGDLYSPEELTSRLADMARHEWPPVSDSELVTLVASVQGLAARDAAWASITRADADGHVELWRQAATITDGPHVLPALGLLAMAGWIAGNGALCNVCLDRASGIEGFEDYTLFQLVQDILTRAIHPSTWTSIRGDLLDIEQAVS